MVATISKSYLEVTSSSPKDSRLFFSDRRAVKDDKCLWRLITSWKSALWDVKGKYSDKDWIGQIRFIHSVGYLKVVNVIVRIYFRFTIEHEKCALSNFISFRSTRLSINTKKDMI